MSTDKEAEQRDLDALRRHTVRERELAFAMMREIDRATPEALGHMGYGRMTKDEAIAHVFRSSCKKIDKLTQDFVKLYPDDK